MHTGIFREFTRDAMGNQNHHTVGRRKRIAKGNDYDIKCNAPEHSFLYYS